MRTFNIAVLFLFLLGISCSSNDDSSVDQNEVDSIVNNWKLVSVVPESGLDATESEEVLAEYNAISQQCTIFEIEFMSDNTGFYKVIFEVEEELGAEFFVCPSSIPSIPFTWSLGDTAVTLTSTDDEMISIPIEYRFENNRLYLSSEALGFLKNVEELILEKQI